MTQSDPVLVCVPRDNPNDESAILVEWPKENATPVKEGDVIAILEASKAAYEVTSPADGYLFYGAAPGDRIEVGKPLAYVSPTPDFHIPASAIPADRPEDPSPGSQTFTRKALKLLRESGLDRNLFAEYDQVTEQVIQDYVRRQKPQTATVSVPFEASRIPPSKVYEIQYLEESARDLIYSKVVRDTPHSPVENKLKAVAGISLGELVIHACARALKAFPLANAFHAENRINCYQEINIGVAVNLDGNLKVPVIRNVDLLSVTDVSERVKDLSLRCLRGELKAQDFAGGTFTVTDLSSLNVADFDPVVNLHQAAILGIGAKKNYADSFGLILGFNHKVMDGMYAAKFLNYLVDTMLS